MLRRAVNEDPELPHSVTSLPISPRLEEIVMRLLSRRPESRPTSARALLRELEALDDIGTWTEDHARKWWVANKGQIDRARGSLLDDLGHAVG
jgi:hypothetical protein